MGGRIVGVGPGCWWSWGLRGGRVVGGGGAGCCVWGGGSRLRGGLGCVGVGGTMLLVGRQGAERGRVVCGRPGCWLVGGGGGGV